MEGSLTSEDYQLLKTRALGYQTITLMHAHTNTLLFNTLIDILKLKVRSNYQYAHII